MSHQIMPPDGTRITRLGEVCISQPLLARHVQRVASPGAVAKKIGTSDDMVGAKISV
jgi:hypothetical protein